MLTNLNLLQGAMQYGAFTFNPGTQISPVGAVLFVCSATSRGDGRGRVKFIQSSASSPTAGGQSGGIGDPNDPLATVFGTAGALTFCKANRGDVIIVLPGHTENLSANSAYSVPAGVQIIGVGNRTIRPAFTFTGGTATAIAMAAGAGVINCHFDLTGVASVVKGFNVTGAGANILGCRILQASVTNQATNAITVGAADTTIAGTDIDSTAAAGAANAIISSAAVSRLRIFSCDIRGDFSTAPLVSASTNHITNMTIDSCLLYQLNATAKVVISFTTSSTGIIQYNTFYGKSWSTAAGAIASSSSNALAWIQNFGADQMAANPTQGILTPAAGTLS